MPSTFLLSLGLLLLLLNWLICLGEGSLAIDDRIANPVTGRRLLWEKVPDKDDKKDATKKVTSETTTEAESPAEEHESRDREQNVSFEKSASKSGKQQEEKTSSSKCPRTSDGYFVLESWQLDPAFAFAYRGRNSLASQHSSFDGQLAVKEFHSCTASATAVTTHVEWEIRQAKEARRLPILLMLLLVAADKTRRSGRLDSCEEKAL